MNPRSILALAGITAAMVAIAAFVFVKPFWGDDAPSAEANPAVYGLCNVSVSNIPDGVRVAPFPAPAPRGYENTPKPSVILHLLIWLPRDESEPNPTANPATGISPLPEISRIAIEPVTGVIADEHYRSAADEKLLAQVLSTLRVGPWEPAGAAWPRTDTNPPSKLSDPTDPADAAVKYRVPEPGSGIVVGRTHGDTFSTISAYTCDSLVEIDAVSGEVIERDVSPGEQETFDRFISEVRLASGKADSS